MDDLRSLEHGLIALADRATLQRPCARLGRVAAAGGEAVQRKLGERLGELGSADAAVVKRALILVADELRQLSTRGRRSAAWLDAAPTNAHSLGERVGKALLAYVDAVAAKTSDDHVLPTLRSATAALQESRKGAAVALTTDADRLAGEKERALAEATEQAARLAASLEERVGGCMAAREATVRSFSLEVAHLESALAALAAEEGRRRAALGRLEEAAALTFARFPAPLSPNPCARPSRRREHRRTTASGNGWPTPWLSWGGLRRPLLRRWRCGVRGHGSGTRCWSEASAPTGGSSSRSSGRARPLRPRTA